MSPPSKKPLIRACAEIRAAMKPLDPRSMEHRLLSSVQTLLYSIEGQRWEYADAEVRFLDRETPDSKADAAEKRATLAAYFAEVDRIENSRGAA